MNGLKGLFCLVLFMFLFGFAYIPSASAHQPVLEREQTAIKSDYFPNGTYQIKDPTLASLAIYGRLASPTEVDVYSFTADTTAIIPVQILVPVRTSNHTFEPALLVIGSDVEGEGNSQIPFGIPPGNQAQLLYKPQPWPEFFEPFSLERLFEVAKSSIPVTRGSKYYLAVYAPGHQLGDYTIGIGENENFSDSSLGTTVKMVGLMKLGLVDKEAIPWVEICGLFLFLMGVMISLGITFYKLTHLKYRLWLGYFMAVLGAIMLYHQTGTNGVATFQAIIALILFGNNFILGRKAGIPESLEGRKSASSRIVSLTGWSAILFLLVWYLMVSR